MRRAPPDSEIARTLLLEADFRISPYLRAIRTKFNDPIYVPKLLKLAEGGPDTQVLGALQACGARDEALALAWKWLKMPIDEDPEKRPQILFQKRRHLMTYLALESQEDVLRFIDRFFNPDVMETIDKAIAESNSKRADDDFFSPSYLEEIRKNDLESYRWSKYVILALIQGEDCLPSVREAHEQAEGIWTFPGAWIMYAFGDDTDIEIIRAYAAGTLDVSDLHDLCFQYVRTPRTDAVLLERLTNGLSHYDTKLFYSSPFWDRPKGFAQEHLEEIVPLLLEYLRSPDERIFRAARESLMLALAVPELQYKEVHNLEPGAARVVLADYARERLQELRKAAP